MYCNQCGAPNPDNANNCISCGAQLNTQNAQQNAQPNFQQPNYQQPNYQQPNFQQPNFQQPMYGMPPVPPVVPGKGLGIAGMVLGILSLVLFCYWVIAIPLAIIGISLSGVGMSKAKAVGMKNSMATAGIVCSSVALGVALIFTVLVIIGAAELGLF